MTAPTRFTALRVGQAVPRADLAELAFLEFRSGVVESVAAGQWWRPCLPMSRRPMGRRISTRSSPTAPAPCSTWPAPAWRATVFRR